MRLSLALFCVLDLSAHSFFHRPFHNRLCKPWTECTADEYEVLAPSAFQDRVCSSKTTCDVRVGIVNRSDFSHRSSTCVALGFVDLFHFFPYDANPLATGKLLHDQTVDGQGGRCLRSLPCGPFNGV